MERRRCEIHLSMLCRSFFSAPFSECFFLMKKKVKLIQLCWNHLPLLKATFVPASERAEVEFK